MILNLKRNAIWSIAEIVISGISLFLLYKYLVSFLGLAALGIWSLVLASTSLIRLSDLGGAAGLSRFVALALTKDDRTRARDFVETSLIASLCLYTFASALFAMPLWWGMRFLIPSDSVTQARMLLPYALASFALLNINSVTLSALVGMQRTDIKCKIVILSLIIQIVVVLATVPFVGLIGMALGQIAQYAVSIALSWLTVRSLLGRSIVPILPRRFNRSAFSLLFSFGIKLQLMNLISFAFEPLTKFIVSAVGGLQILGIFEMTYRMVLQARHLIVAPMNQLVPAFAHLNETNPSETARLYIHAVMEAILMGTSIFLLIIIASPLISRVWIDTYDPTFIVFTSLLCLGWLVNALATPAYLLGIGSGRVRWNITGHLITTLGSPALGYLFGKWFGSSALVFGISISLAAGSACTMLLNCADNGIRPLPPLKVIVAGLRTRLRDLANRLDNSSVRIRL
jgi:O-antigen/teichoic acid export membrane protein